MGSNIQPHPNGLRAVLGSARSRLQTRIRLLHHPLQGIL